MNKYYIHDSRRQIDIRKYNIDRKERYRKEYMTVKNTFHINIISDIEYD